MLQETYSTYVQCASGLGDYQKLSKTELANGYCKAEAAKDELRRGQYFAGLILRYWYKIYEWSHTSASTRLETEDFVGWLVDGLNMAFKYKAWLDPKSKMYGDPNGPDKVFNRCLFSIRNYYYQNFNKDKRKLNYTSESLEEHLESSGDSVMFQCATKEETFDSPCAELVQALIDKNRLIEALITDNISFQDAFKELRSQGNPVEYVFDTRKLIKSLSNLNTNYMDYFLSRYEVEPTLLKNTLQTLGSCPNSRLYDYVGKTLTYLKEDKTIKEVLC